MNGLRVGWLYLKIGVLNELQYRVNFFVSLFQALIQVGTGLVVLSPFLSSAFVVDSASHDTTSFLATIEHRFGVAALSSRDAAVRDLSSVFTAKKP